MLLRLSVVIEREYAQICAEFDLPPAQAAPVCAVPAEPRRTADLASALGMTRDALAQPVDRVERRGARVPRRVARGRPDRPARGDRGERGARRVGLRGPDAAHCEAVPVEALPSDLDRRTSRQSAEQAARPADLGALRAIEPDALDVETWTRASGRTPPGD